MPAIDKPNSQLAAVQWRFPSVHPEGRKFVLIAGVVALGTYWGISHFLGWLLIGVTIWVAAFFRDPVRVTPRDPKYVVAPADGLVTMITKVAPPPELAGIDGLGSGTFTRVSIFMSVFDVHINRARVITGIRNLVGERELHRPVYDDIQVLEHARAFALQRRQVQHHRDVDVVAYQRRAGLTRGQTHRQCCPNYCRCTH